MLDTKRNKRNRRQKTVKYILKYMRNNRLPDKMTGRLLQSLHWHLPIYLMLLIIHLPVKIASVVIIIGFMIMIAYFYYGGCILTSVENYLINNTNTADVTKKTTIVDPIILLFNDEINSNTRHKYSMIGFIVWITILILIYLKRIENHKN